MSKNYIIPEEDLIALLADSYELDALRVAGVDSWSWYGANFDEYIMNELEITPEEDSLYEDLSFEDIAKRDLQNYMPL